MYDQSYLDLEYPAYPVRWVVSVSSGASSAVAAERTLQRFGADNVDLVFADTLVEDGDNYRFLADLEKRWNKKVIRLTDGRKPQAVWDDKQLIPNDQFAPCTYELKLRLIIEHVKALRAQGYAVVMCVGYSLKDTRRKQKDAEKYPEWLVKKYPGRLLQTALNWASRGLAHVEFPCLWYPVDFDVLATVKSWGVDIPRMYGMGFTSANCQGKCPKGGLIHWRRTLTHFPQAYREIEDWERNKRTNPKFADRTILTREVDGETVGVTLEQLRFETEQADARQLRLFEFLDDAGAVCTTSECGVGWDDTIAA